MSVNDRIGIEQSRQGVILDQTTRQRTDRLDPDRIRGHDLLKILAIQGTADVRDIVGHVVGATPIRVFEGGTYPQIVTFRTGMQRVPFGPPMMVKKFARGNEPKTGDLKALNCIPLDTSYADEHTVVVRPGECWWALFDGDRKSVV